MQGQPAQEQTGQKRLSRKLGEISLDRYMLDELMARDAISPEMRLSSLTWLHPPRLWAQWSMLLLAAFGTGLVLSGIIFFFAFNWTAIPDMAKLAMIEGAVILAACLAWFLKQHRFASRMSLLAASILVGVFLATFGQIYQSGADMWQLFALWALLILPWTAVSQFPIHWLLWLGLVNLALILWWDDHLGANGSLETIRAITHVIVNGTALAIREVAVFTRKSDIHSGKQHWLSPPWTRWILLAAILLASFEPLLNWLTDLGSADMQTAVCGLFSAFVVGLAFFYYRMVRLDIQALAMVLLLLCIQTIFVAGSYLADSSVEMLEVTLLVGIMAIVVFALAAGYLRRLLAKQNVLGEEA